METLNVYRCGTYYSGLYLDEKKIKTEPYEDFDSMFSQQLCILGKDYHIIDHYNNPFSKTTEFTYWFDEPKDSNDLVYVQRDIDTYKNGKYYGITVGIHIHTLEGTLTTDQVMKRLIRYQELREHIYRLFKEEYGKEEN